MLWFMSQCSGHRVLAQAGWQVLLSQGLGHRAELQGGCRVVQGLQTRLAAGTQGQL